MPRLLFGHLTNPTADILQEIETFRRLGFDYIELGIEEPEGSPEALRRKKAAIRRLLKKFEHPPLAHTWWGIELGSYYPAIRSSWMDWSKAAVDVAAELGCIAAIFHAHARGMRRTAAQRRKILTNWVVSLKELVAYGRKRGIKIYLENPAEKGEISELKDFKWIVDRVPGLGVHVDVGHAFLQGGMPAVEKWVQTFRSRLVHFHLHDNHGQRDEHLPLGKGRLDYKRLAALLKRIGYRGTATFEVFTDNRADSKRSMEKLARLL